MRKFYDYKCNNCGKVEEHLVKGDNPVVQCSCGSTDCTKLVSAPGGIKTNFHDRPKTFTNRVMKYD